MRVGVYVDAFNLYYGARSLCGRSTQGWRWLDLRSLSTSLAASRRNWTDARVDRIVYCTALIDQATNLSGFVDQDVYLKALRAGRIVDQIELGHYVARVKQAPLAVRSPGPSRVPRLVRPQWPITVQDSGGTPVLDGRFMASYASREEKGSDVNVASHLLVDVLTQSIDAAILISNDSDLRFPVQFARDHVPVGVVNPSPNQLAGALRGRPDAGVGRHWWYQLSAADLKNHQLPDPVAGYRRPAGW
jgi:hypothetical protein